MPSQFTEAFALREAHRSLGSDWQHVEASLLGPLADSDQKFMQAMKGDSTTHAMVDASFRSAISQLSVVSFIEQNMQTHQLSDSNKNLIREKHLPHWLCHPMSASSYVARVRGFGLPMNDEEIRSTLHLSTDTQTVTLFQVLTATLNHVETVAIDNGTPDSVGKKTIRQIDSDAIYILLASAMAPLFTAPNSQGVPSKKLSFIMPLLSFLDDSDNPKKVVLGSLPSVVSKREFTARRDEAKSKLPYLEVLEAFGRSTRDALEDTDDPRHESAKAICMLNDKLNIEIFRERLLRQIVMEEFSHNRSSAVFMRAMTQNAEDTEDPWYMGYVNEFRAMFPGGERHRDYTIDEFIESFRLLRTNTFQENEPHTAVFDRLRAAQQEAIGLLPPEPPFLYAYAIQADVLQKFGLPANIQQIILTEYEKGLSESVSRFQMSLHIAVGAEQYSKICAFWIVEDELGMFVMADAIDRQFTFDEQLDAQVIHTFAVLLEHAVSEAKAASAATTTPSTTASPVRIASFSQKGEAQPRPKDTKRKAVQNPPATISTTSTIHPQVEEKTERARILPLRIDWDQVNEQDTDGFKRAASRYEAGYRGIKKIQDYGGPTGGPLYELRSGTMRYMLERRGDALEFVGSTPRKDLFRWISTHGIPR